MLSSVDHRRLAGTGFLMIVLVLYIHAMGPLDKSSKMDVALSIQTFVGNGIARVAVPFYFLVSGLLFFNSVPTCNPAAAIAAKIRRRLGSLLVPYLAWSALGMLLFLTLAKLPGLEAHFRHPDNRIAGMTPFALLARWVIHPVPGQLWFLRDLLLMTVASPAIASILKPSRSILRIIVLITLGVWWLQVGCGPPRERGLISSDAMFFFTLGAVVSKVGLDRLKALRCGRIAALLTVSWLSLICVESAFALGYGWSSVRHLIVLVGISATWCLALRSDRLWNNVKYQSLTSMTFFVFVAHQPAMALSKKVVFARTEGELAFTTAYLLLPLILLAILIVAGTTIRQCLPACFRLLNGGRGSMRTAANTQHSVVQICHE